MEDVGPRDAADDESSPPRRSGPRPRAPQRRSPDVPQAEPVAAPEPAPEPRLSDVGTPTPVPPPAARPAVARTAVATRSPKPQETSAGRMRQRGDAGPPHLARGAGEHFLPLPHARLVDPHDNGRSGDVVVITAAGAPVHAVCAGTVRHADGGSLRIEGEDGHTCHYSVVRDARVAQGDRIDGGAILGVIGTDDDGRHVLHLEVFGRDQTPIRPHDLLLGAADPNELGYGSAGTGVDVDPDARAGRGTASPRPAARTQPAAAVEPTQVEPAGTPVAPAAKPVAPTRPVPPRSPVTARPAPATADATPPAEERPAPAEEHPPEPPAPRPALRLPDEPQEEPPAPRPALRLPDEPQEEPQSAPAEQSAEERRKRAAMLIARGKRRPNDSR